MDRGLEAALDELRDRLDEGLFLDNLEAMLVAVRTVIRNTSGHVQVAAWTIENVLADLHNCWDDRPLRPITLERANEALMPLLGKVLHGIRGESSPSALYSDVERLVASFFELQDSGAIAA